MHAIGCHKLKLLGLMMNLSYEYLVGDEPLFPIYMQLQMTNQSIRFLEGIAKDVMVRIHDHYALADFMVLDMGEEEDDTPIILGRPFLNTTNAIIYVGSGQVHFQFPGEKVRCYFNSYTTYETTKEDPLQEELPKESISKEWMGRR